MPAILTFGTGRLAPSRRKGNAKERRGKDRINLLIESRDNLPLLAFWRARRRRAIRLPHGGYGLSNCGEVWQNRMAHLLTAKDQGGVACATCTDAQVGIVCPTDGSS